MGNTNCNGTVAGVSGRRKCNNVAGVMGRRCNNNVAGESGRRFDCEDVLECLVDVLSDALEEMRCRCHRNNSEVSPECGNRRNFDCEDVLECLADVLADALEEDNCHKRR